MEVLQPIAAAADALPLLALRPGADVMGQLLRRGSQLLPHLAAMRHLGGAFAPLVDKHLSDPFLRHWVDLLCFLISGMPMADTNAAAMATLFGEWFDPEASLDYPKGGSASVAAALVRGLEAHGGQLQLRCSVRRVLLEGERAVGVQLENDGFETSGAQCNDGIDNDFDGQTDADDQHCVSASDIVEAY